MARYGETATRSVNGYERLWFVGIWIYINICAGMVWVAVCVCVGGEREGWAEAGCVASCDSHLPLE